MRSIAALLYSAVSVFGSAAQTTCSISTEQMTICRGDSISLTAVTNMTGVPNSGALPFILGGGVTDIEGNSYTSAIIGTQEWMTQNLRTSTYANGDAIPFQPVDFAWNQPSPCEYEGQEYFDCWGSSDTSNWGRLDVGAYCFPNNDPSTSSVIGKLYHGLTFTDPRGLCPNGWHTPSVADFAQLLEHAGINLDDEEPDLSRLLLSGSNAIGFNGVLSSVVADVQIAGPNAWRENVAIFGCNSGWYDPTILYPTYVYPQSMNDGLYLNYVGPIVLTPYWSWHTRSCRCIKDSPGTGDLQYQWSTGATSLDITEAPNEPTVYTVNITNGTDDCTCNVTINVSEVPHPTVTLDETSLFTPEIAGSYQWYLNGSAILGANEHTVELQGNGNYVVEVTSEEGCTGASEPYIYLTTGVGGIGRDVFRIHPNPNDGLFWLEHDLEGQPKLSVFDISGRQLRVLQLPPQGNGSLHTIDLSELQSGSYLLHLSNDVDEPFTKRMQLE